MPQGHDVNVRAGPLQRSQRNGQLDLLEAVGRQGRDLAALESASGEHLVLLPPDGTELASPTRRGVPTHVRRTPTTRGAGARPSAAARYTPIAVSRRRGDLRCD